ncbi:hypothetical protein H8B09_09020 [Paenibacillus sp. PR3]|uniref:Polymerase nucleotidyl transferase domain-containing protein n=1 Tax=Paenibacillus terricola TaxID=2763503 RepID=A0ABR8MUZ7_9BACL|nr:hypothetical protein [Paenibacillus terricola]MBD3918891.1 hypothetical protein [Paenibacillus terricola]
MAVSVCSNVKKPVGRDADWFFYCSGRKLVLDLMLENWYSILISLIPNMKMVMEMLAFNSDREMQDQTRTIIQQVSEVYRRHTEDWFIGLVVHGSAVKGGFIKGWSDIDFQLYLEDQAFDKGHLPLTISAAIHRELSQINPNPYQYIQTRVFTPSHARYGRLVPDTYEIISGKRLFPELTNEQLYIQAVAALDEMKPDQAFDTENLLEHGDDRLLRSVRIFCTTVWPALYQMLTIQTNNGIKVWGLTKAQAVEMVPRHSAIGHDIQQFYEAVLMYASNKSSVDQALNVIEAGIGFLQQVRCWQESREGAPK